MALSKDEQWKIMVADHERRVAREEAELAPKSHNGMPIDFVPNHARIFSKDFRANRLDYICSPERMYKAAAASDDPLSYATVKVTRNGQTSRVPAGDIRRRKSTTKTRHTEASRRAEFDAQVMQRLGSQADVD